jgi:hypothetical protein
VLFTCCGPCAMFAWRANITGGFLIAARVSSVARHWPCAFRANRVTQTSTHHSLAFLGTLPPSRFKLVGGQVDLECQRSPSVRSKEEAAEKWKLSFAFDLPPNAKTGLWREWGRRRLI